MRYRFIRTGERPIEETDHDHIIRQCFSACTPTVKDKLEAFFNNPKEQAVTFKFKGQTVIIARE